MISICLVRDYGKSNVGFAMKTAYPNIDHEKAKYIKDITDEQELFEIVEMVTANPSDILLVECYEIPEIKERLPEIIKNPNISDKIYNTFAEDLTLDEQLGVLEVRQKQPRDDLKEISTPDDKDEPDR